MKMLVAAVAAALSIPAAAQAAEDQGKIILEARLRAEFVDQDPFAESAQAVTLRTRFGYETAGWRGFKLLVEGENVIAFTDTYNSTLNGQVSYPTVPDPEVTELNRAQISWTSPRFDVVAGRQRIILGNARYVGNVGFRQNEQTFDAIKLVVRPAPNATVTYAYIDNVRRVFGPDSPQGLYKSDSHLFQVDVRPAWGQVSAFAFLLDFANAPTQSSATWGLRITGARPLGVAGLSLTFEGEYSRQTAFANNPADFTVDYVAAGLGLKRGPTSVSFGYERLGSDGVNAFQTPLATLHAYQGWADAFLTTPAAGVREFNLRAATSFNLGPRLRGVRLSAAAFDFASANGAVDYGQEVNLSITAPITRRLSADLSAASLNGEGPVADRTKVWLTLEFKY